MGVHTHTYSHNHTQTHTSHPITRWSISKLFDANTMGTLSKLRTFCALIFLVTIADAGRGQTDTPQTRQFGPSGGSAVPPHSHPPNAPGRPVVIPIPGPPIELPDGYQFSTSQISDGAIAHDKIALDAVVTPNLRDGSVSAVKIARQAVTGQSISEAAVTGVKIAPGAVDTRALAPNSITQDMLAAGVVGPEKLGVGESPACTHGTHSTKQKQRKHTRTHTSRCCDDQQAWSTGRAHRPPCSRHRDQRPHRPSWKEQHHGCVSSTCFEYFIIMVDLFVVF